MSNTRNLIDIKNVYKLLIGKSFLIETSREKDIDTLYYMDGRMVIADEIKITIPCSQEVAERFCTQILNWNLEITLNYIHKKNKNELSLDCGYLQLTILPNYIYTINSLLTSNDNWIALYYFKKMCQYGFVDLNTFEPK